MQSAYSSLSSSPTPSNAVFHLSKRLFELVSGSIFNPELPPHSSHLRANYLIGKRDFDVGGGDFVIVFGEQGRDFQAAENGPSFQHCGL